MNIKNSNQIKINPVNNNINEGEVAFNENN